MSAPSQQAIAQHLSEAVERLQKDIEQVELWAAVLSCFSQPVPDYQPDDRYRLGQTLKRGNARD